MPILNINLDPELHQKLKDIAKRDERSLNNLILRTLRISAEYDGIEEMVKHIDQLTFMLENQSTTTAPFSSPNVLPKNVTATYKIKPEKDPYENMTQEEIDDMIEQKQIEAFQARAKAILGQKLDIYTQASLTPDNRYYDFAEPQAEGRLHRWAYTMPIEKQKEYIEEWKQYLD